MAKKMYFRSFMDFAEDDVSLQYFPEQQNPLLAADAGLFHRAPAFDLHHSAIEQLQSLAGDHKSNALESTSQSGVAAWSDHFTNTPSSSAAGQQVNLGTNADNTEGDYEGGKQERLAAPTITQVMDDAGTVQDNLSNGGVTNDDTPTVRVNLDLTHAAVGDTVQLFNAGHAVHGAALTLTATDIHAGYADVQLDIRSVGIDPYALASNGQMSWAPTSDPIEISAKVLTADGHASAASNQFTISYNQWVDPACFLPASEKGPLAPMDMPVVVGGPLCFFPAPEPGPLAPTHTPVLIDPDPFMCTLYRFPDVAYPSPEVHLLSTVVELHSALNQQTIV